MLFFDGSDRPHGFSTYSSVSFPVNTAVSDTPVRVYRRGDLGPAQGLEPEFFFESMAEFE